MRSLNCQIKLCSHHLRDGVRSPYPEHLQNHLVPGLDQKLVMTTFEATGLFSAKKVLSTADIFNNPRFKEELENKVKAIAEREFSGAIDDIEDCWFSTNDQSDDDGLPYMIIDHGLEIDVYVTFSGELCEDCITGAFLGCHEIFIVFNFPWDCDRQHPAWPYHPQHRYYLIGLGDADFILDKNEDKEAYQAYLLGCSVRNKSQA